MQIVESKTGKLYVKYNLNMAITNVLYVSSIKYFDTKNRFDQFLTLFTHDYPILYSTDIGEKMRV